VTTIATLITNGFADAEIATLQAAARGYYGLSTVIVSPDGGPVVSAGGLRVLPDAALGALDPAAVDALVVCGGTVWTSGDAPDIADALRAFRAEGKVVAVICDAVMALAASGLIDGTPHTGNSAEQLAATGYAGGPQFVATPAAVAADGIVTAPGTAPVSFMAEVLRSLGKGGPDLDFYLGLLAAEHQVAKAA
jgi:putative intracellular protease/amidase